MRMRSERETAKAVGVLYIAATVAGVLSAAVIGSVPLGPGISPELAANQMQVVGFAFLALVMALAVSGVAYMMYPILMQDAETKLQEGLSLWYVGSRITEGVLFVVAVGGLFSLLALSGELAGASDVAASALQPIGTALWAGYDYAWVLGQSVFCVGAVMLYYLLYRSRRIPRWLSIWGLIAAPLMLVAGFTLPFTGDPNSAVSSILYAPMGLQEMVLAVWLIARGFNPSPADLGEES